MAEQTAVEWFMSKIIDGEIDPSTNAIFLKRHINKVEVYEQAKQMEKEQIIKATLLDLCWEYPMIAKEKEAAEKYYNDTYKTELHDK